MANDARDPAQYWQFADRLRQLARQSQFNLCRRDQLLALAAGFERFAARLEQGEPSQPRLEAAD